MKLTEEMLQKGWLSDKDKEVAILLEPTEAFHTSEEPVKPKTKFRYLFAYMEPYKKQIFQLFLALLGASLRWSARSSS